MCIGEMSARIITKYTVRILKSTLNLHVSYVALASYPGPSQKKGEGLVYTCLRMRETTPGFYGGSYNSVPYRRLYLWTVRERPFYCLGVALRVRPPVVKVYILFSTAVIYARIMLRTILRWCTETFRACANSIYQALSLLLGGAWVRG